MKYIFVLALKNIMRAKRRTVLTFLMLSFGIAIYIMMAGMLDGWDKVSFRNLIDFETGHLKIRSTTYDEDRPYDLDNILLNVQNIEEKLINFKFIKGTTKRLILISEIDNRNDSIPVMTIGLDMQKDQDVFTLNKFISKGKLTKGGAIIGEVLAKDMNLKINDLFYISFRNKDGMFSSMELELTGLILSSDPRVNSSVVYTNLNELQEVSDINGITEIAIKTIDYKSVDIYAKELQTSISEISVFSWRKLAKDFASIIAVKKKSTSGFLLMIMIIAVIGIINTILISVLEKQREIGTLKALGFEDKEVRNIFLFEGIIIGTLGCIGGIILGSLFNLYFVEVGIDYTKLMGGDNSKNLGMNVFGVIKSTWVMSAYIEATLFAFVASLFASYYPAKKVMKMQPVDCLRIT